MRPRVCGALAALLLLDPAIAAAGAAEPRGYRMEQYRAPVPGTIDGGTILDDDAAHALWQAGDAVFVDVLPRAPKPEGLPEGTFWRDPARRSIPGAVWLPDVGYGHLAPDVDAYFRGGLESVTGGDADVPIVFFCLSDCWMSWNAARRAIAEYGYTRVHWYPAGTDGWSSNGWPTEAVSPRPRSP